MRSRDSNVTIVIFSLRRIVRREILLGALAAFAKIRRVSNIPPKNCFDF